MKVSKLVGLRFKEKPADCVIDSHALMVRGGYIKNVANGILNAASIKIKLILVSYNPAILTILNKEISEDCGASINPPNIR